MEQMTFIKRIIRKKIFLWMGIGIFILSPLVVNITMQLMKFPFMMPELFLFPLLFLYRNKIKYTPNRIFHILLYCFILLLIISILLQKFSYIAIFSTARGYLYLILSFAYFYNRKIRDFNWLIYLSIGSLIGWSIVSLYNFNLLVNGDNAARVIITGNLIALILAITIPIIMIEYRKYLLVFIPIIIILFIFSGMRRAIFIVIITVLLSLAFALMKKKSKTLPIFFFLIILTCILFYFYPSIESFLETNAPELYRRIFLKTQLLLEGNNESDTYRYNIIKNFLNNIENDTFPQGFVTKRSSDEDIYIDFPIYELSYMFSFWGSIIFAIFYIKHILFHVKNYIKRNIRESGICIVSSLVMISLLFIEGSFLNYPFVTPFSGFILARIFSNKNLLS